MHGSYLASVLLVFGHFIAIGFEFCDAQPEPSITYNANSPGSNPVIKTIVHCIDSELPLLLADPFDISERSDTDHFVMMQWVKASDDGENPIVSFLPGGETTIVEMVSIYQNWGIKISPVTFDDSGTYRATLLRTTKRVIMLVKVIVARAPSLASQKLTITSQKKDKKLILQCGEVASLGQPPINLEWQSKNGTVLNSMYKNGSLQLDTTSDSDEEYFCEMDHASPARECIPLAEKELWDTSYKFAASTSGADTTGIIIGVAITVVVLLIIVVIAFCISRRRKVAYNTKKGEKKKVEEVQSRDPYEEYPLSTEPEDFEDGQEAPRIPSKVKNTSPYMVSNVNPANAEASHYASSPVNKASASAPVPLQRQQKPAPKVPSEESNGRNGGAGGGGDPLPPKPKPRSRYFDSQEDLSQVGKESGGVVGSETCV